MSVKKAGLIIIFTNAVFLLLDRYFKSLALADRSAHLIGRYFGWHPYFNSGIGFGLPVPRLATITITFVILALLLYIFFREINTRPVSIVRLFFLSVVIGGALSNWWDRIIFHNTVDYIFLVTGYFNIADVLIVIGFGGLLILSGQPRR